MYRMLLVLNCLLTYCQIALAQLPTGQSLLLGPVVAIDQVAYRGIGGGKGGFAADVRSGPAVGLMGVCQANRLQISAKAMYVRRSLQQVPYPGLIDTGFPNIYNDVVRTNTDLSVLSMPVGVAYRILPNGRFHWYLGGSLAIETLLKRGNKQYFDRQGNQLPILPEASIGPNISAGFGLQSTFQYAITPWVALQLEPAICYYPYGLLLSSAMVQAQGTAAVLIRLDGQ
ncbi:hypothetical protein FAES_4119 [Fibrella aestuarina BUZ 2]|uniref:Outer membrane protein beta-barrel domain-containing protein n=1 Tax=Fibrella aestuarina BUZ 2 TaxID=1166018 RepID=I0KDB6_9BACT|nr:hypothetical protein [Fibrella aestuarina]CCH02119.1 hypothetical protein FAES_4119 [Fibrella aestuarina BUZ 2]